jgi:hypothetical protein
MNAFAHPTPGRLHGLVSDCQQLGGEGVQVDLLTQAGGERLDGRGGVEFAAVEAAVDRGLDAAPGRLKARLRPMRGLKQDRGARVVIAEQAFMQNIGRAHHELAIEEPAT